MQQQLSKLHVRFIQTQKSFFLTTDENTKGDRHALSRLYIKDSSSFYFVNEGKEIQDGQTRVLLFKESNDFLDTLACKVSARIIDKSAAEHEDALLFFHLDASEAGQILHLSVESIDS